MTLMLSQPRRCLDLSVAADPTEQETPSMKPLLLTPILAFAMTSAVAVEASRCQQSSIEKSVIEICLLPGAVFQHDVYTLKVDKVLLFSIVDDFVERVELLHTVPEGPSIEFPSRSKAKRRQRFPAAACPKAKTARKSRVSATSRGANIKSSRTFASSSSSAVVGSTGFVQAATVYGDAISSSSCPINTHPSGSG
jgi:hypothetical protein